MYLITVRGYRAQRVGVKVYYPDTRVLRSFTFYLRIVSWDSRFGRFFGINESDSPAIWRPCRPIYVTVQVGQGFCLASCNIYPVKLPLSRLRPV